MTYAGVQVCAQPLKRGDSLDFTVAVPAKPAQLRQFAGIDEWSPASSPALRRVSLASTAASWSSRASRASSVGSTSASSACEGLQVAKKVELVETVADGFTTCLCPHCLEAMPLILECPQEEIYAEGVQCDHCKVEMLKDDQSQKLFFCHCARCSFDLCRACAYKEMRMWWGEA